MVIHLSTQGFTFQTCLKNPIPCIPSPKTSSCVKFSDGDQTGMDVDRCKDAISVAAMKSRIASSLLRHFSFIVAVVFSIFCDLSPRLSRPHKGPPLGSLLNPHQNAFRFISIGVSVEILRRKQVGLFLACFHLLRSDLSDLRKDGAVQTAVLPAGTIATTVLPTQEGLSNNGTGLPVDPILPTETRVNAEDGLQGQVQEDDAASSNAGDGNNQGIGADHARVDGVGEVAEPSMRDILEAMKLMGAQLVTLTQVFTPLVIPPVGQEGVTILRHLAGKGRGEIGLTLLMGVQKGGDTTVAQGEMFAKRLAKEKDLVDQEMNHDLILSINDVHSPSESGF
ncbi:hypothetical protein F2Q70_00029362 [Brassica cretica]|uniref:Uncharacterized protein n=1 Tax=Brassica cretica TaxID=69181 RepID=A0A8S9FR37_BRACR|nr:hypothetical protein F2Q70_00029362 [Brassica cretica]